MKRLNKSEIIEVGGKIFEAAVVVTKAIPAIVSLASQQAKEDLFGNQPSVSEQPKISSNEPQRKKN